MNRRRPADAHRVVRAVCLAKRTGMPLQIEPVFSTPLQIEPVFSTPIHADANKVQAVKP